MTYGQKIKNFIDEMHAKGKTVYASNTYRVIKIQPKHKDMVRVKGEHCEIQRGKAWESINYCRISAI